MLSDSEVKERRTCTNPIIITFAAKFELRKTTTHSQRGGLLLGQPKVLVKIRRIPDGFKSSDWPGTIEAVQNEVHFCYSKTLSFLGLQVGEPFCYLLPQRGSLFPTSSQQTGLFASLGLIWLLSNRKSLLINALSIIFFVSQKTCLDQNMLISDHSSWDYGSITMSTDYQKLLGKSQCLKCPE
jgi:hypothetical protein